jgi:hypothetical protein
VRFSGKVEPPTEQKGAGGPFLRIVDAPSLNWGTDDFTLLVVAGYDNPLDGTRHGSFGAFYSKWGGDRPPSEPAGPEVLFTGNWPVPPMTAISAIHIGFGGPRPGVNSARQGVNDGAVRLYGARRAGDVLEVRINGAVDATTRGVDDVDVDNPGANVGIGSMSGDRGIRALRGDILLLVAIRGAFPADDLRRLEDSIKARFQLSP